jgi:hypothetical protein
MLRCRGPVASPDWRACRQHHPLTVTSRTRARIRDRIRRTNGRKAVSLSPEDSEASTRHPDGVSAAERGCPRRTRAGVSIASGRPRILRCASLKRRQVIGPTGRPSLPSCPARGTDRQSAGTGASPFRWKLSPQRAEWVEVIYVAAAGVVAFIVVGHANLSSELPVREVRRCASLMPGLPGRRIRWASMLSSRGGRDRSVSTGSVIPT